MFVSSLPVSCSAADTPPGVLDGLSAGVIIVNADGRVSFANRSAAALFPALHPVGLELATLLGLSGVSNAAALAEAAATASAKNAIRIGLSDGRVLDSRCRPLPEGGSVVTLHDVTLYVRETEQAARDALTGLPNRSGLHQRLTDLLEQSQRTQAPLAVLFLDLDRFKAVNDTLGHAVGDALLCKVAERLRNAVRKTDIVARLGGDEFAIIQAGVPQPQASEALAGRLVDLIGRTYVVSGHSVVIGASVGVALSPADGNDGETLLQHADIALYRAKTGGRGMFRFFQPEMNTAMQTRRLLETDLRSALPLEQFELAYQPQVQLEPYALVGFEALLRWHHPVRGLVSPASFIPLAEEIGLISTIGTWVLRTACRAAAAWPEAVSVAVNVSPIQFRNAELVQTVTSALDESGLSPTRLDLEITEGALLDNTDTVLRQLFALKQLGIRISMDDFGTGYSSLSYLRKFPFEKIKIDQSFVRGSDHDADCGAIVRAVSALGASLGVTTTAEGVETQEQLTRMKADGCNQVQGYFTGRPMNEAGAAALVAEMASKTTTKEFSDA